MSEYEKIALGQETQTLDVSPQFDAYSGVEIVDAEGNSELVGTRTGRVITIPGISRTQAQAILANLSGSGFQYQPYTATGALLNPAAELGDGVTINGTYSGIYKMSRTYSPLMRADISAPQDEEIDHEYPFEPKQDRVFKREIAQAMTRISQTEDAITLEATRASTAEGNLSSRITQNATNINAKVSQTGGSNSSFGWSLTSSKFSLYSGNTEVFKCNSSGVEIKGKITATSGYIGDSVGGFEIVKGASGEWKMQSGKTYLWDSHSGVYVGTNGISCGSNFVVDSTGTIWADNLIIGGGSITLGSNFKVTNSGNVTANNATFSNATITGNLTVGGKSITAATLQSGAQTAYNWSSNGTASGWTTGAGYGVNYNKATQQGTSSYPASFKCGSLTVTSGINCGAITTSSINYSGKTLYIGTIKDYYGNDKNVIMYF